ncbi:TMEM175 family protein [Streptomyces malaysiensis]|uniref:TMEM175 family protein n=1 Tax=Streptomyces malaysiensis subsp. samsunensis TaxID=459658 RepID=A0A9X2M074_STRMQ|nr:TMEM175 family protein [Streptomyces samsunensis]MCQ8832809.1 TMEM175 family protein [Streptomyces samsunensis]
MRPLHGIDVERIRAFADAVFAIAITLLALEITVPEDLPAAELGHALEEEALPSVAGYLLSFVVVGALWISHHRLFRMAKVVDGPLLYLDLTLMALVAALPFPTKIITEYHSNAIATSLHAGTITLAALLITAMAIRLLGHPGLCDSDVPRPLIAQSLQQAVGVAIVFGSSVPVAMVSPDTAEYCWLLAVPVRFRLAWHHTRRHKHAAWTAS